MSMATKPGHFLEGKKIIVAGSGIAGLAFVVAFRKLWDPSLKPPEITIYDRDTKETSIRREGYSLSLNGLDENSGLVAMRDLGLLDETLAHSVVGSDSTSSFRMWNSNWGELNCLNIKAYDNLATASIRIARKDLRYILMQAGEAASSIVWGTACVSAERLDTGHIRIHLWGPDKRAPSLTEDCDLLIAADGAHSKIRASFRPDDGLEYAGAIKMGGVARFPDGLPAPVKENWGLMVTGEGISCLLFARRQDGRHVGAEPFAAGRPPEI